MLMTEVYSLFFFAYIVGLGFLSNYFLHRNDTKVLVRTQEEYHPETFIGERAYQHLKTLNDFGPKVVGSRANEIYAANYIHEQVKEIKINASVPDDVIIDHQISSGFNLIFQNYENLQNIVVRVQGETDHALMLNCHFDSVPGSPGASDDTVSCCVMMEILQVLSKASKKQKHSVIFVFNGSEETGLQAAHAFITQHKWREDVKAYLNLESSGSGGKEALFRSGPKHDWLVKMYRESVPRPYGNVFSEELFETGAIPSATDFQIYRDYGSIPGLDFAYVEDGWRYHTRYDSVDYIKVESVQHTGNNILALTKKIANSEELANPPEGTSAIYFEYLGLFFISYSATAGVVINYIVSIFAFLIPFAIQTKFKLENVGFVAFETIISLVTMIVSIVLSGVACLAMAAIMNAVDNTMSWFNTTFISIGIYGSLALLVQIGTYHVMQLVSTLCLKTKKYRETSKRHRLKINLNGVTLFWSILTITVTAMGLKLGYIFMIILFMSLCTYLLTYFSCLAFSKSTSQSWIFVHIFGHSVLFLFTCYMFLQIHQLFIPIAAKAYSDNPDIFLALICVLWVTVCLCYFIPLTLLIRFRAVLYSMLAAVFIIYTVLAFTSFGFPYSDAKDAPRLQRFQTSHIKRSIVDSTGTVNSSFNTVIIYAYDRNGIRTIENAFNGYELKPAQSDKLCKEIYQCGYISYPLDDLTRTLHINAAPNIKPTQFKLIRATKDSSRIFIEFSLQLRTSTSFALTVDDETKVVESNVGYVRHKSDDKSHSFGIITFGVNTNEPFVIQFQLEGTPKSDVLARLTVMTEDSTFDQGEITPEFDKILYKLPNYVNSHVHQSYSVTYEIKEL